MLTGAHGPRNITYVLPILQALGLVGIDSSAPNSVWLTTPLTANAPGLQHQLNQVQPVLLTANQFAFALYLSGLWSGEAVSFPHCYRVSKHHSWNDWKLSHGGSEWWCQTLSQENEHYSWPEKAAPHDFASIAARLCTAIAMNDDGALLVACKAVFAWGGVARKPDDASLVWVEA